MQKHSLHKFALSVALLCGQTAWSEEALTSAHLAAPESILPYLQESADFWKTAWDPIDLAFFSDVSLTGRPSSQNKAFLAQSRNAYAFSKAFAVTGDTDYLTYADGALRYLYDFGWDASNGGWWAQAESNGSINTSRWYNDSRWSFWQHYMLLGPSAYIESTGDSYHSEWLALGNEVNDLQLWDDRPGFEGYYSDAALNWSWKSGKGFTPTVDAITTSALTNYLMSREPLRRERLTALGDNILYMLNGDHGHIVSFPSSFNNDWEVNAGSRETSIGHHIKTAWCLARVFLIEPDPAYRLGAEQLLDQAWSHEDRNGLSPWDHDNNIMRGNIDVFDGTVGGATDWWTVEQGFTGGIMNWYVSRKPEYLQMADQSLQFFMEHYYDYDNGEVFSQVASNGTVTDRKKGDMFKAGYHSVELFYLVYLYGNLYYHNKPVTLYYNFAPEDESRAISLWPIAYEDDRLMISSVQLNGGSYGNYDGATRTLSIPSGVGGVFKVTFESRYSTNPPAHFDQDWWGDWFGWYYHDKAAWPWVYHSTLGWSYAFDDQKTRSGWFYNAEGDYYYYTTADWYPAIYREESGWQAIE